MTFYNCKSHCFPTNLVMSLDNLPTGLIDLRTGEKMPAPRPLFIDNVDEASAEFRFASITNLEIRYSNYHSKYKGYYSIDWACYDEDRYIYLCTFYINIEIKFDELLVKMVKLKKLCIINTIFEIVEIKQFPGTLTTLTNYSETILLNLPDSLRCYSSNTQDSTIIPKLPEQLNTICLKCKCLGNSFYSLPSLITNITIDVSYFKFDIDIWPMNLEKLTIRIGIDDHNGKNINTSIGVLPYGLKSFSLEAGSYNHPFDMPPTLEKFSFITNEEYHYPECFDNLPDSIKTIMVSYKTFPDITKLPKKCKTFIYMKCPNDVFKSITKNKQFKGISFSKKKQNNF